MRIIPAVMLAGLLLFTMSGAAAAQGFDVGAKLGYSVLTGDTGDTFDGAFAGGVSFSYDIRPGFALQGSWLWHKHDASEEAEEITSFLASEAIGLPALTDVRLTINEFDLNGKFSFSIPPVNPYLLAGFGLYYWKIDGKAIVREFDRTEDETFWDLGINFGGGVSYPLTEAIAVGAEVVYTHVFDEFDDSFFNFLATLSYGFYTPAEM